ncbi:hypothetical protein J2S73_000612 [Amorphus orientalis]|uniref:Uncharacterized protein n=1 Tax=Amorphus orientalis TaxID=649198 RepID=A0AAE4ARS3_9HYPH|nr:hypothetical protein [Amorphus orientalis]
MSALDAALRSAWSVMSLVMPMAPLQSTLA